MSEIDRLRRAIALLDCLEAALGQVAWDEDDSAADDVRHAERQGMVPWHEAIAEVLRGRIERRLRGAQKGKGRRWPA
jgi:hypothetical protein